MIEAKKASLFPTGASLSGVMQEIKLNVPTEHSNIIHSLVMKYHNTLIEELAQQGLLSPEHPNFK